MPNADGIALLISENATVEDGRVSNVGYLAVKIAESIESGDYDGIQMHAPTTERAMLEAAIDRMGWPEIHAFNAEMRKGQSVYEDAGGYIMRGLRRLFGMPEKRDEIVTYQQAARAMIDAALSHTNGERQSG
jgi:hypothetical protein